MGELERLAAQIEQAIHHSFGAMEVRAGKVSVWIRLVRPARSGEAQVEETVGGVRRITFHAVSLQDLVRELAENLVLAAFGSDLQLVDYMPNLIIKLFDRKRVVAVPGAPPVDQPGQIYLKATVYRWEPGFLDRLFGTKEDA